MEKEQVSGLVGWNWRKMSNFPFVSQCFQNAISDFWEIAYPFIFTTKIRFTKSRNSRSGNTLKVKGYRFFLSFGEKIIRFFIYKTNCWWTRFPTGVMWGWSQWKSDFSKVEKVTLFSFTKPMFGAPKSRKGREKHPIFVYKHSVWRTRFPTFEKIAYPFIFTT